MQCYESTSQMGIALNDATPKAEDTTNALVPTSVIASLETST